MRMTKRLTCSLLAGIGFIAGCQDTPGAATLRWNGAVDLDVAFSEFFNNDHTIAMWFMMQYPYGPAGPIIAENGSGTFMVGQGDYRWGNGGFLTAGDPVLFARIGNSSQTYIVPELHLPEKWAHLAIVRSGNTFTLYVNGNALSPSLSYNGAAPVGNLRLGRRTNGAKHGMVGSNYIGQFYGFVDDVAVFDQALSGAEINTLRNSGLSGNEPGLVAGFRLGFGDEGNTSLPLTLRRSVTPVGTAYRTGVEEPRNAVVDAGRLPLPKEIVELTLPYVPGEAWKVVQGMDDFDTSHNGKSAFSLDMVRANSTDSTGEPLYAVADGTIVLIQDGMYCDPTQFPTGSNAVVLEMAPGENVVYHHLERNSAIGALGFGPNDILPPLLPGPQLLLGDQIGNCGSTGLTGCGGAHLHISVRDDSVSHPFTFSNYEVSDDSGRTWHHVDRGIPKQGQWVRRLP